MKGSTATTTTGPATYLGQDYQNLAGEASNLYGGATSQFPSFLSGGLSDIKGAAPSAQSLGATGGNYFNTLESGSLLNPATNPSLQGVAKLADQQVMNNLSSEFAGSGRNIEASAPIQANQMGTIASQIYGGAYNNTLNNMTSGLGQTSQLTGAQFMPGNEMLSVPSSQLSAYGSLLGGMPGGTQSTPYYQNLGAGALGGALLGAQTGSSIGGSWMGVPASGWGSILGGLAGMA